jgi:hypothetical protein
MINEIDVVLRDPVEAEADSSERGRMFARMCSAVFPLARPPAPLDRRLQEAFC